MSTSRSTCCAVRVSSGPDRRAGAPRQVAVRCPVNAKPAYFHAIACRLALAIALALPLTLACAGGALAREAVVDPDVARASPEASTGIAEARLAFGRFDMVVAADRKSVV